jgi:signal transduction histidine kinase
MAVARRRRSINARRRLEVLLGPAIQLAGLAALVVGVYLIVVIGIGRVPTSDQRTLLGFSMAAAAVAALLYQPLRGRLSGLAARLAGPKRDSPSEVIRTLGSRLTSSLPLDELLLQLAESLRRSLTLEAAEVWTGSGGVLERYASDPEAGQASLILTSAEEAVVARAGVPGSAWLSMWLPQVLAGREASAVRAAPITHAGELLGLIVVERKPDVPFSDEEEQVLAALARQVGLALNNVRLGTALEASLGELQLQADELRASRARVVAAADAERRRIERDLHDGAQQHLVALAVNLRLARELADSDPVGARAVLEELAGDVHKALEEIRVLAHGIYPKLLEDRGLSDALHAAVSRAPVRPRLETDAIGRYGPEVEVTVYFCCLEAIQNVGKHAGRDVRATLRVWEEQGGLRFEVADDGAGFDPRVEPRGSGLTNMSDRLGALGGRLSVVSAPGDGTRVAGVIPLAR